MKRITIEDVLKNASSLSKADKNFIRRTYTFARKAHRGQKRKSGEPYIVHPLYTAYYIADLGLGKNSICAALLHDVIEDCGVTEKQLKKNFNPTVAKLVVGVSKLRHTGRQIITESSLENLRRFLLVAAEDIRVLIIKLADRLHNAKTIHGLSPQRRKTYAKEIQYIYSALSEYLGVIFFKRQFDDVAFRILQPVEYKRIESYLDRHHKKRYTYVGKVRNKIQKLVKEHKVKAEVEGREKSIFGIYKKVQRYLKEGKIHSQSEYGRIYDYYAFRVIVKTKEDCYRVLGIIHSTWHPLPGELDDYIANPKPNGYRALQTNVFCEDDKLAEIQILTEDMHEYNEFGPASHIAYKLSGRREALPSLAFNWLRRIKIFRRNGTKSKKSPMNFRIKLFKKNIFVLTPQNEVKKLPRGGTPIDLAYAVHTEVGNKCRGAKVNGKMVPLDHELQTGDQVEILIDKNVKYPVAGWLEFAVASNTRAKIKHVLRDKEENEAIEKGIQKLNKALKKYKTTFNELYRKKKADIDIIVYKNNAQDVNSLLSRIGFDLLNVEKITEPLFPKTQYKRSKKVSEKLIAIEGSTQTQYTISKCCNPKANQKIIALTTATRGIRIHRSNCQFIKNCDKKRVLHAKWV